ncbi:MAG: hypothetical protein QNI99_07400 [Woeseiaceae bacterium]|nr:hypothetical protein [Woeseiaceae bacterium]
MRPLVCMLLLACGPAIADHSVFNVPNQDWGISFDSGPLVSHRGEFDGTRYDLEAETQSGFLIVLHVEPAPPDARSDEDCRDHYWPQTAATPGIIVESIRHEEFRHFLAVAYCVGKEVDGEKTVEPHTNYYSFKDGQCVATEVSQSFLLGAEIDTSDFSEFAESFRYVRAH